MVDLVPRSFEILSIVDTPDTYVVRQFEGKAIVFSSEKLKSCGVSVPYALYGGTAIQIDEWTGALQSQHLAHPGKGWILHRKGVKQLPCKQHTMSRLKRTILQNDPKGLNSVQSRFVLRGLYLALLLQRMHLPNVTVVKNALGNLLV